MIAREIFFDMILFSGKYFLIDTMGYPFIFGKSSFPRKYFNAIGMMAISNMHETIIMILVVEV